MFQNILPYVLLLLGFVVLIKGADLLVDGASSIAKKLKISALVIGLTIVAFGTSAPELIVNVMASAKGSAEIAVGNVVGSNIANILLILGVAAIIFPLRIRKSTTWKEIPFAMLAVAVLFFVANDALIDKVPSSILTRIDALVLLSFFGIFMYYTIGMAKEQSQEDQTQIKTLGMPISILFIVLGLAGLILGGKWVVDGAVHMAKTFGLSESLIGLTIVAVGTSLPEFATSAVAAYKKQSDIAVGNVVGSNIFNIFLVLGVSGMISPIPFSAAMNMDILVCVIATLLLFLSVFVGNRHQIDRWQGVLFFLFYAGYIGYLIMRG